MEREPHSTQTNASISDKCGSDLAYGCLFCRTGKEKSIVQELMASYTDLEAIAAQKVLYIRQGGVLKERYTSLLPGYIFVRAQKEFPVEQLSRKRDVYRVLSTSDGMWQLSGKDKSFAQTLFDLGGIVGLSKIYYEGNRIRPVDGLLKEYDGCIVRVDRRKSKAQVCFHVGDRTIYTWLGFEEMKEADE